MLYQLAFSEHSDFGLDSVMWERESNPFYVLQVKVEWSQENIHITGIQKQDLHHCQKPKLAGWLSQGLYSHWYYEGFCFLLSASTCIRPMMIQLKYTCPLPV